MSAAGKQAFMGSMKRDVRQAVHAVQRQLKAKNQRSSIRPSTADSVNHRDDATVSVTVYSPSPKRKSFFEYLVTEHLAKRPQTTLLVAEPSAELDRTEPCLGNYIIVSKH